MINQQKTKKMKRFIFVSFVAMAVVCFNSCATLTGTQDYTARVIVENSPNAAIIVDNTIKGYGETEFAWKRANANKLSITVEEEGYKSETISYNRNSFRTFPFLGNIILGGIPGIIVDLVTGAVYEPDITEKNITKIDTKTFLYKIYYSREAIISKNNSQQGSTDEEQINN